MSYITPTDYDRFLTLPIALPQTELRKQAYLHIGTFILGVGQRLEMCCCHLQVFKVLTPGVSPILADNSLGLCSAGLLASTMLSSAVGLVTLNEVGTAGWNQDQPVIVSSPGTYRVIVLNNSTNVDLAVVVTGNVRIYS